MKPSIQVENLSKLYTIGALRNFSFNESILNAWNRLLKKPDLNAKLTREVYKFQDSQLGPEPNTFWSLKDVNFTVNEGEIVGIVGRNGSGKSTLLKILSRITEPTLGRAVMVGRVASLLSIGAGFHPDLTGRENVYLNGAILGMRKWEINRKFHQIVDFSEMATFIDTPIKRYSSGMYVRLAFAVAAHLNSKILFVDEVLASGDAAFQTKCLKKITEISEQGRTILLVSHNMDTIKGLCKRTMLFSRGQLLAFKNSHEVIDEYLKPEQLAKPKTTEVSSQTAAPKDTRPA